VDGAGEHEACECVHGTWIKDRVNVPL